MHSQDDPRIIVLALAASGALAGLAQLLLSSEKLTLRLAIGRAVSTAILSTGALLLPYFMGHLDQWQLMGAGCLILSVIALVLTCFAHRLSIISSAAVM